MLAAILTAFLGASDLPLAATVTLTPKVIVPPVPKVAPKRLPTGPLHSHRCPCGAVWTHDDSSFGNRAAHTCPACSRIVWNVHQRNVQPVASWSAPRTRQLCPT